MKFEKEEFGDLMGENDKLLRWRNPRLSQRTFSPIPAYPRSHNHDQNAQHSRHFVKYIIYILISLYATAVSLVFVQNTFPKLISESNDDQRQNYNFQ